MSQNQDTQSPPSASQTQALPQTQIFAQIFAQRLRLAATIIEHSLPWQFYSSEGPWESGEGLDVLYLIRNGWDIRITPLEAPSWSRGFHNPDGLPDAGGPEWRFCLLEELDGQYAGVAELFMGDKWKITGTSDSSSRVNLNTRLNCRCTYRLLRSVPFPDPPAQQPWALGRSLEGFGELQPEQEWYCGHRESAVWTQELLAGGYRPLLWWEKIQHGDEFKPGSDNSWTIVSTSRGSHGRCLDRNDWCLHRTKRPLPRPEAAAIEPVPVLRSHEDEGRKSQKEEYYIIRLTVKRISDKKEHE